MHSIISYYPDQPPHPLLLLLTVSSRIYFSECIGYQTKTSKKAWERTRKKDTGRRKEKKVKKGGKRNKNVPKRMEKYQKNEKEKTKKRDKLDQRNHTNYIVFLVPNFVVVCDWVY